MIRLFLLAVLAGCPLALHALPTTDGEIALGNLEAQIAGYQRAGPAHRRQLMALYQTRAQYLGHPDDYGQALRLADELVAESPRDPEAYLARAGARASLHRFKDAWADVAKAATLHVRADHVDAVKASLWQATGKEENALPFRERMAHERPDIDTLGELATLYGQLGRIDEAEAKFAEAVASYRDVSPFIVAWLDFQNGLMEERAGRPASALALYQAAHDRLPAYAPVTGHLAGLLAARGEQQHALRLLQPLADRLDDPEYAGQYAALQQNSELRVTVGHRFDELLRKYPEAYWDHAARFWIASDPKKALALALRNLGNRANADAFQLVVETAVAAGKPDQACRVADRALELRRGGHEALKVVAARAYLACNQKARAEALLSATAAASPAPSPSAAIPRR